MNDKYIVAGRPWHPLREHFAAAFICKYCGWTYELPDKAPDYKSNWADNPEYWERFFTAEVVQGKLEKHLEEAHKDK